MKSIKKIKVLAINTSPRKGRNTEQLLEEVLAGCRSLDAACDAASDAASGIAFDTASDAAAGDGAAPDDQAAGYALETELIGVCDADPADFKMCRGCWACAKTGSCVCGDDFIKRLYDRILAADVVIFGVPVYFYSVPAQCKAIMDRALAYMPVGTGKIALTAMTCGSAGVLSTLQTMQSFYSANDFLDAGWVATYGKTKDKEKGKEVARNLGRKAVRLAGILGEAENEAAAAGDKELLADLQHSNHFAYGTHTF